MTQEDLDRVNKITEAWQRKGMIAVGIYSAVLAITLTVIAIVTGHHSSWGAMGSIGGLFGAALAWGLAMAMKQFNKEVLNPKGFNMRSVGKCGCRQVIDCPDKQAEAVVEPVGVGKGDELVTV